MDYSKTAVNLSNPKEVEELLIQRQKICELQARAREVLSELLEFQNLQRLTDDLTELDSQLKALIDKFGSYQDAERKLYALKQERTSVSYDPSKIKITMPQFADAVIEEVANKSKIEGLLKGGLIDQKQADACAIIKNTYAYVIRS